MIDAECYQYYEEFRQKVDARLASALHQRNPSSLYTPAEYILVSPGKRIRPVIVLFAALSNSAAVSGTLPVDLAVSVEMLHNFTLVHDDIMDNSDQRRGMPTLHKKYDLSTAILAGDALLALAYEFLLHDARENTHRIVQAFNKGLIEVCEGQSMDKDFEVRTDVTLDEYTIMIQKKTAAMVEMCCTIGAVYANHPEEVIASLAEYGRLIGIAFQIQDDLLDITADQAKLGKPTGADLLEGKKTYLFLRALQKATGAELESLKKVIAHKGVTKEEIPYYRDLYKTLGVLEDAGQLVHDYTNQALAKLQVLPSERDIALFTWLANSLLQRTK